jgi:hypothetical protein
LGSAMIIMGSTLVVFFLGLEWIARIHHKLIPFVLTVFERVKQNGII